MKTRLYLWLKNVYFFLKKIPFIRSIAQFFVDPVEKWLGPKSGKLFDSKNDFKKIVDKEYSAAIDGLSSQLAGQNEKIHMLEKELSVLKKKNHYVLLYTDAVSKNAFSGMEK